MDSIGCYPGCYYYTDSCFRKDCKIENNTVKQWQVWSEGYRATGESGSAQLWGTSKAETFKEACILVLGKYDTFDVEHLTLWGCKLFDNGIDARRNYG